MLSKHQNQSAVGLPVPSSSPSPVGLPKFLPINLPALSTHPVQLHPILLCQPLSFIAFDLNKQITSIVLHPYATNRMAAQQQEGWLGAPAAFPPDICSLTIRIAGVDSPVVIVAATKGQQGLSPALFITVWDVLFACHRAWGWAKAERNRSICISRSYYSFNGVVHPPESLLLSSLTREESQCPTLAVTHLNAGDDVGSDAFSDCYFRNSSHWGGLTRSETEPEVWVLYPSFRDGWRQ